MTMTTYSIIQKSQLEGALRLDAEYYQPEYLELIKKLDSLGVVSIKAIAELIKRKFKPEENKFFDYIEIAEVDLETGEYNTQKIIGKEAPDRAQWTVEKNDVLISTVRPIRNAIVLVKEKKENLVCSSGFAVLKPIKISPQYLFIYLKTKSIIKLLDRLTTASMYPAITLDDVLNTKIYLGEKFFRDEISKFVDETFHLLENSKSLYSQAENLLLEKLGLKDFEGEDDLSYIINLLEINKSHRADAEYFQPKYDKLISKIRKSKIKLLSDLVSIKKGIEIGSDQYQEEGKLFIRVSSLSRQGLIEKDQKYLSEELYQKLKKDFEPEVGEILLTKDATPGIAYNLKEPIKGIIAGGILRLKIKEKIEPEYLTLVINSIVGQAQIERDTGGSVIIHWRPEQIKTCLIPILPKSIQQKITDLVHQSHGARKKAKELLQQAKTKVENLIK